MTAAMKVQGSYIQCFLLFALAVGVAGGGSAQALYIDHLAGGTALVVVAQPLADATTVTWPRIVDGEDVPTVVTSGDLTLVADLEAAFGGENTIVAPPVVVAVG